MWRVWVRRGWCIWSWWGNRRKGDHWGDLGVDGWIIQNNPEVNYSPTRRWGGHVARMGEERGVYRVLVGKPDGKRPLERHRRRCVDNIRMDL